MYKNIEKQTKLLLKDQVQYQAGQVVSKTLVQNEKVSMTIFSFDKGEEISTHAAPGDAMVTVLEGKGRLAAKFSILKPVTPSSCQKIFPMQFLAKNSLRCSWWFRFNLRGHKNDKGPAPHFNEVQEK